MTARRARPCCAKDGPVQDVSGAEDIRGELYVAVQLPRGQGKNIVPSKFTSNLTAANPPRGP
jgi:hypothetical protein